ncbi:MAG: YqgE/AlgH family protein [Vicinamibacterales bacterium]|nr:YqgE/AlgH family protein [Vicinamibacterales bacterium]
MSEIDPTDAALAPVLLISMPQLTDPNFLRTVVLLCDHGEDGAFGLVVNRRMEEPAHEVIRPDPPLEIREDVHLYTGGPVEPFRAWVLTASAEVDPEAMRVTDGVYLAASPDLIRQALQSPPEPGLRIVVGYAGWAPGQLEVELAESSWLIAPVQADLVFETPIDEMWATALRRLGADPAMLHSSSGVH